MKRKGKSPAPRALHRRPDIPLPDRRAFLAGVLAASAAGLTACGSGGSAGQAAEEALVLDDGTPRPAALMEEGPLGDMAQGDPDAPATLIEYASLTCPYCRKFHTDTYPRLKKELIDTGRVRYIVREFPIGNTAAAAAVVTRCAPKEDRFTLFEKYLTQQKKWTSQEVRYDALYEIAAQTGMSRAAFDRCLENQELIDGVKWSKQRGRELGVTGTPTFFINGEKETGVLTFEQIKARIGSRTG